MFVDSHCHLNMLDLTEFNDGLEGVLARAKDNKISHMLCVSVDKTDFEALRLISDTHENIYFSTGIHPHSAHTTDYGFEELLIQAQAHPKCIAMGETGLDYFRLPEENEKQVINCQIESLQKHIEVAKNTNKPLIIHTRDAGQDTIAQLKRGHAQDVGGVIHCFTETWEFAKQAMALDFYISFSGIVTFKNAKALQEVAKKVPLDRMLIETDSPYLAPTPYRGKQNHPALVKHVAEFLADLRGESVERIAEQTTDNFFKCFRVS